MNPRDAPGYLLRTQEQGAAIAAAIGRDRLGLNSTSTTARPRRAMLTTRLAALLSAIDHMQLADVPRPPRAGHRRDSLGIRLPPHRRIGLRRLDRLRNTPRSATTVEGLAWRQRYGV